MRRRSFIYAGLGALAACTINPVTGERELALVSAVDEVAIGEAQYAPSRQMQGGDYVRDPELTRYVNEVGQGLAAVSDRALPYEFVVLNSSVPNAWALPGGKIAVNRGLLVELESEAELAAVLGHEIVHAAARHGAQAMQRGMLLQGAVLAAAVATRRSDYSNLAVGAASLGAQLIYQRYGRDDELESDRYGMQYMARAGYDPSAAVSLQETFVRLSEDREQGWLAGLFASHPPSAERVAQNRATAASLPGGGDLGRERYVAAIAGLQSTRGAYASHDRGREALAEDDFAAAENEAQEALRLVPDEAQFHALLGDIDFQQKRYADAVRHYRDAIANNDRFFYFPLRKGFAHLRLMEWDEAQTNLAASIAMLPTADAYYGLGTVASSAATVPRRSRIIARQPGPPGPPVSRARCGRATGLAGEPQPVHRAAYGSRCRRAATHRDRQSHARVGRRHRARRAVRRSAGNVAASSPRRAGPSAAERRSTCGNRSRALRGAGILRGDDRVGTRRAIARRPRRPC
jgi:predicted Zn-dependent protease